MYHNKQESSGSSSKSRQSRRLEKMKTLYLELTLEETTNKLASKACLEPVLDYQELKDVFSDMKTAEDPSPAPTANRLELRGSKPDNGTKEDGVTGQVVSRPPLVPGMTQEETLRVEGTLSQVGLTYIKLGLA